MTPSTMQDLAPSLWVTPKKRSNFSVLFQNPPPFASMLVWPRSTPAELQATTPVAFKSPALFLLTATPISALGWKSPNADSPVNSHWGATTALVSSELPPPPPHSSRVPPPMLPIRTKLDLFVESVLNNSAATKMPSKPTSMFFTHA